MALTNRPITPKQPKFRNSQFAQVYRRNNPNCEVCLLRGIINPHVEMHHLVPGLGRSDYIWCVIMACHPDHMAATPHVVGMEATKMNDFMFGIKYHKGEISDKKLMELKIYDEVMYVVEIMAPLWKRFKEGKLIQ